METYIVLAKYTQKGSSNIKEGPKRIDAFRKALKAAGCRMISWHLTMGHYDLVVVLEAPDTKTAASELLTLESHGNVIVEPLRALTETEFKEIVSSLA